MPPTLEAPPSAAFTRILHLGRVKCYPSPSTCPYFAKVNWDGKRLSITGVEGPTRDGNARGSSGQCVPSSTNFTAYSPGWSAALVDHFAQVWDRWHLNDMRSGCEHQRASWDISEPLEVVEYNLTTEARTERTKAIESAARASANGEPCPLTPLGRALVLLPDPYLPRHSPPDADDILSGCYEVRKRETKAAGWVYPHQHTRGLLTKPCEVCGYKYGTAWLYEPVPSDVLAFLRDLPPGTDTPAWI